MKKIFILASERSGTNLLRILLGNHSDLEAPIALHVFDSFIGFVGAYGPLEEAANCSALLSHVIELANHDFNQWELQRNSEELYQEYNPTDLLSVMNAVYSEKAKSVGATGYVCKDNHLWNYMDVLSELEDAYFIYLFRDPRDHVSSWLKTPIRMFTSYDVATKWQKEQEIMLNLESTQKLIRLSYESLISDPSKTMDRLLRQLGLTVQESCFQTSSQNSEAERNELWKNLSKPILTKNSKKYKSSLSKKDILIVESICKTSMEELKYQCDTNADWKLDNSLIDKWRIELTRRIEKRRHFKRYMKEMQLLNDKILLLRKFRNDVEDRSLLDKK